MQAHACQPLASWQIECSSDVLGSSIDRISILMLLPLFRCDLTWFSGIGLSRTARVLCSDHLKVGFAERCLREAVAQTQPWAFFFPWPGIVHSSKSSRIVRAATVAFVEPKDIHRLQSHIIFLIYNFKPDLHFPMSFHHTHLYMLFLWSCYSQQSNLLALYTLVGYIVLPKNLLEFKNILTQSSIWPWITSAGKEEATCKWGCNELWISWPDNRHASTHACKQDINVFREASQRKQSILWSPDINWTWPLHV